MARRGVHGEGHVWQGVCMAGGMCGRGMWQGGMHGKGDICGEVGICGGSMCDEGVCMVGGMHGRGACMVGGMHAGETTTEAGRTHPTGMHSCDCIKICIDKPSQNNFKSYFDSFPNNNFIPHKEVISKNHIEKNSKPFLTRSHSNRMPTIRLQPNVLHNELV